MPGIEGWRGHPCGQPVCAARRPAFQGSLLAPMLYVAGRNHGLSRRPPLAAAGALLDLLCLVEQQLFLVDAAAAWDCGAARRVLASDHHALASWAMRVAAEGVGIIFTGCTKMTGFATRGERSPLARCRLVWRGRDRGARARLLEALARLFFLMRSALAYLLINVRTSSFCPTPAQAPVPPRDFHRTLGGTGSGRGWWR